MRVLFIFYFFGVSDSTNTTTTATTTAVNNLDKLGQFPWETAGNNKLGKGNDSTDFFASLNSNNNKMASKPPIGSNAGALNRPKLSNTKIVVTPGNHMNSAAFEDVEELTL